MRTLIVTTDPNSFTAKALHAAAAKRDEGAQLVHVDDLLFVQHPQGDHVTYRGEEVRDYDTIFALVDDHCPQYEAVLDALESCCKVLINGGQVYRDTMDELALQRKLQRALVKFPATVSICSPDKAEEVATALERLKGDGESLGHAGAFPVLVRVLLNRHKNGLLRVDSLGALRSTIEALCEEEIPFVVQEHVHHRGAFTAYVFAGETLVATVREVGDADDEFRAGANGELATAANLDTETQGTLARISNLLGRSLIEVTFIKGPAGEPFILDVKPYVRLESLNHSTGAQVVDELTDKLFDRLSKLTAEPAEEPVAEPVATDVPDDELPSRAVEVPLIVYPLNDDKPLSAKLQTEEDRHTIYVQELEGNDNYLSFRFGAYKYRLPRRDAVESATDGKKSFHHVALTVKRDGQTFTLPFTLTDEGESERAHQVWVNPDLLPTAPLTDAPIEAPEPEETNASAEEVPAEAPPQEAPMNF